MDALGPNPLSILTFIVAPAILTNAASISALATSNRLARGTERARAISAQLESEGNASTDASKVYLRVLQYAEKRVLLLVRALTAYYVAIGSFAAATLLSLAAAVLFVVEGQTLALVAMGLSLLAGVSGVGGLVFGSFVLVGESRLTLTSLGEETAWLVSHHERKLASQRNAAE
ncbi:MAG TPA: DUF2721 domain-containing protein [Pirellulales bacterium]|nr:DUF2721 domain-containing protein [Pirellulales bacterium]